MQTKCSFCAHPSVDSFTTEAGNNAEILVDVELCFEHWEEYLKDELAFLDRHITRIEDLAVQKYFDEPDSN